MSTHTIEHFAASIDASLHLAVTKTPPDSTTAYVPSRLGALTVATRQSGVAWIAHGGVVDKNRMMSTTCSNGWSLAHLESKPTAGVVVSSSSSHPSAIAAENGEEGVLYVTSYLAERPYLDNAAAAVNGVSLNIENTSSLSSKITLLHQKKEGSALSAAAAAAAAAAGLSILQLPEVQRCLVGINAGHSTPTSASLLSMLKVADAEFGEGRVGGILGAASVSSSSSSSTAAQNMPHVDHACYHVPRLLPVNKRKGAGDVSINGGGGTKIITGGFGALGQLVASWLAAGSSKIILVGRHVRDSAAFSSASSSAEVVAVQCDASCRADIEWWSSAGEATLFHASGSLSDSSIAKQSLSSLRTVMAPKLASALCLADAFSTTQQSWVNFSSVASLLGNFGQSNYAAANGAVDGVGRMLSLAGINTTTLQWGPWAGSGMATPSVAKRLETMGMALITPVVGLDALCTAMRASANVYLFGAVQVRDWSRLLRPSQKTLPVYSELLPLEPIDTAAAATSSHVVKSIDLVVEEVRSMVEQTLGSTVDDVDATFMAAGLDSLGAIELRNSLSGHFGVDLPATVTFDYPSISKLAALVHSEISDSSVGVGGVGGVVVRQQRHTLPLEHFVQGVLRIAVDVLGKNVSENEPFMQAGLDSMGAIELRAALQAEFPSAELAATITYDYPTAVAMGKYLAEIHQQQDEDVMAVVAASSRTLATPPVTTTGFLGFASSYPGAEEMHDVLGSGRDVQQEVPSSRWDIDAHYNPAAGFRKMYVRFGGWLEEIDTFDAGLFRLSMK